VVEDGIPGDNGEIIAYHSCPNRFIPRPCREFYELYRFREIDFPHTMPPMEQLDKRYLAFRRYFLSALNEYQDSVI
jgi:hypothetical protein